MAESFVQLPADALGKKVRTFNQTVGANSVEHQAFVLCDSSGNIVDVLASAPAGTERGVAVRQVGTIDPSDRAARELGRARMWDGTDESTVIPRDIAPTSSDKGLAVVPLPPRLPTYQVVTSEITSATATGVKEILTLWHPNTLTKDVMITEIGVNTRVIHTAGTYGFEFQFISAENGTPGGTTITAQPLRLGDAASGLTIRQVVTGAPTTTGQIFQRAVFPLPAAATPLTGPGEEATILFRANAPEEGITLRNGQNEGLRISQNIIATLTTAPIFTVYVRYIERA